MNTSSQPGSVQMTSLLLALILDSKPNTPYSYWDITCVALHIDVTYIATKLKTVVECYNFMSYNYVEPIEGKTLVALLRTTKILPTIALTCYMWNHKWFTTKA